MELGWPQHLLQPWSLGWLAWWLSPAELLVPPAPHRLGQSSRLRRQLGISSTQLSPAKPHPPARLYSSRHRPPCLPSAFGETRQPAGQSSRHPTHSAWQPGLPAKSLPSAKSSGRQPALKAAKPSWRQSAVKATKPSITITKPARASLRGRSFWRKSPAAVALKRISANGNQALKVALVHARTGANHGGDKTERQGQS